MKRADIQLAWREKVTLCIIFAFLSAIMLFFITGFTLILCPRAGQVELSLIQGANNPAGNLKVALHGMVFEISSLYGQHPAPETLLDFGGKDVSECFHYPYDFK